MISRRIFLAGLAAFAPLRARADTIGDSIIAQLRQQGFVDFEVTRTLLGRTRIEARSATLRREIVFNPQTGEILRDYWETVSGGSATPRIVDPNDSDESSGQDDEGPDEEDDDNSNDDREDDDSGRDRDRQDDDEAEDDHR